MHHTESTLDFPAASALTRGIPRDQALGIRLIALARAAAAAHMAEGTLFPPRPSQTAHTGASAQFEQDREQLLRSQAAGLLALVAAEAAR